MENKNRASNENWEIISASQWRLSLYLDATSGAFELRTFNPADPFGLDSEPGSYIQLSMTKEIKRLGEAWADLCIAKKRATAAKKRLLRLALPLIAAWGYDATNPGPARFRGTDFLSEAAAIADEHNRLRFVIAGCEIDMLMSVIIALDVALSAEKERRALSASIPARPTPAHRAGWL